MKLNCLAAAAAAATIVSGFGLAHHGAATVTHLAHSHSASSRSVTVRSARTVGSADPSVAWLGSPGGQAQVTFNDDVSTLAGALETESNSPTVANHLVFEADARVMRADAQKILATPALLPTVNRAAYEQMLDDFIVVADLLQPGPGYGTTAQDYAAWYAALHASDINVA